MATERLELGEREVGISQSAQDRQEDSGWHVWTNDAYWYRRLEKIGAVLVEETPTGKTYALDQRQILFRKIPVTRKAGAEVSERLKRRAERNSLAGDVGLPAQ